MGDIFSSLAGTKNNFNAGAGATPQQNPYTPEQLQQQYQFAQANQANQNALGQQLLAQSQGQGPNPALAQLQQTTNANNQQAAGLLASQRGLNPALAAKLASENQTQSNQQASGQAAIMRANQQLAAQSQLGQLYGQQGNQALQGQQLINQGNLGNQGINASIGNANTAANAAAAQANAGAAGTGLGTLGQIGGAVLPWLGKMMPGAGSGGAGDAGSAGADIAGTGGGEVGDFASMATYAAHGGMLGSQQKMASGGDVNPYMEHVANHAGVKYLAFGTPGGLGANMKLGPANAQASGVKATAVPYTGPVNSANGDTGALAGPALQAAQNQQTALQTGLYNTQQGQIRSDLKAGADKWNAERAAAQQKQADDFNAAHQNGWGTDLLGGLAKTATYATLGAATGPLGGLALKGALGAAGGNAPGAQAPGAWQYQTPNHTPATMAQGGKVPAMVSPGERYLDPKDVQKVKKGANPMKVGEKIPGKAKVGGAKDSYANDTVAKTLKEGGIVLPRHITQSEDPAANAHAFIQAILAKKRHE